MFLLCVGFLFFFVLMLRRPPRSTQSRSSAASDVYKRQQYEGIVKAAAKKLSEKTKKENEGTFIGIKLDNSPLWPAVFWSVSVSYTHLRAHETVLDLVCRLLLEKKKK